MAKVHARFGLDNVFAMEESVVNMARARLLGKKDDLRGVELVCNLMQEDIIFIFYFSSAGLYK